ncbi:hypothetical protein ABIB82_007767 [Bradyrhizobium sp. i1.8.4]
MEPSGRTKLLSPNMDNAGEISSTLNPLFVFEGVSASFRPTSSAHPHARMNTRTRRTYARLRYAPSGQCGTGNVLFRPWQGGLAPVSRAVRLRGVVKAQAPHANRRSGMPEPVVSPAQCTDCSSLATKGREPRSQHHFIAGPTTAEPQFFMRRAVSESRLLSLISISSWPSILAGSGVASDRSLLSWQLVWTYSAASGSHLKRIIAMTGCHNLGQVRNCVPNEISAAIAPAFNTVASKLPRPPHLRRLLVLIRENSRPIVSRKIAMPSRRKRAPDGFGWAELFSRLAKWMRERRYFLLTMLCLPGLVSLPATLLAVV